MFTHCELQADKALDELLAETARIESMIASRIDGIVDDINAILEDWLIDDAYSELSAPDWRIGDEVLVREFGQVYTGRVELVSLGYLELRTAHGNRIVDMQRCTNLDADTNAHFDSMLDKLDSIQ